MMKQTLISLNKRDEWTAALDGIAHAFGHTWESCYAMHLTTHQPTYLYVFEQDEARVVCPLAERTMYGHKDLVTPYGFSGFTGKGKVEDFQFHWKQFAREAGYVCGYIGLNPLFEKAALLEGETAKPYNLLYVLDLSLSTEELYANLSTNRKRQVRSMEKMQHRFSTDKPALQRFFLEHFNRFFAEKNAAAVYQFSDETLSFLAEQENVVLAGIEEAGQIVALSVFAHTTFAAEYLFNLSLPEGKQYTAPLIWWAVNYFQSIGVPKLNLGGGVQENDSLSDFKQRFGGLTLPLKCLKQVYAPDLYREICISANVNPDVTEGYFPPYRNPVSLAS